MGESYGDQYNQGDTIKLIYNPYKATLTFYKNGESQGVIKNIECGVKLSYRLCVSVYENQTVQLI